VQVEIAKKKRMLATRPYAISENQTVPNRQNQICGKNNNKRDSPKQPIGRIRGEKEKKKHLQRKSEKMNKMQQLEISYCDYKSTVRWKGR